MIYFNITIHSNDRKQLHNSDVGIRTVRIFYSRAELLSFRKCYKTLITEKNSTCCVAERPQTILLTITELRYIVTRFRRLRNRKEKPKKLTSKFRSKRNSIRFSCENFKIARKLLLSNSGTLFIFFLQYF